MVHTSSVTYMTPNDSGPKATSDRGEASNRQPSVVFIMPGPLVSDIGHIAIPVQDMKRALGFYRDLLGLAVEGKEDAVWTVIAAKGGRLTLYRLKDFVPIAIGPEGEGTPFLFHVEDFGKAAEILESKGVRVKRETGHSGIVWDPFGNALGLHDHLESPG